MKTHLPILLSGCLAASLLTCSSLSASTAINDQTKALNKTVNQTKRIYLSGTGLNDTKNWAFHCSEGANSGKWDSIPVPAQWELHGFGDYTYGRWYTISKETKPSMEVGHYKTSFIVPTDLGNKNVRLVFQGVMTDAEVLLNGKSVGDKHHGAFYEFGYDITDMLEKGKENILEVIVSKHSENNTVNAAERKADWWLFGGIYRPVFLEISPETYIKRVAVDAKADGTLDMKVYSNELPAGASISVDVKPYCGPEIKNKKSSFKKDFAYKEIISTPDMEKYISKSLKGVPKKEVAEKRKMLTHTSNLLTLTCDDIATWNPESPNLYVVTIDLKDKNGNIIHSVSERIGFRTVEFKEKDGIYLNGTKLVMKGINRHSFHPDGGRTTNKDISIEDAILIKQMNMNAVRMHYSPDDHFLEVCDSLGLLFMDELCGWQNGYDAELAPKLLTELIEKDANHPCIIMWSNGNEGGWSTSVDSLYNILDLQQRPMVHPWADYGGIDTHHYPAFLTGIGRFTNGYKVFLPTEFMHGMYDQGHGAGLEDFWNNYTSHPLFAGGFMWDFSDNAVKRVDKGGILDSDGSNATDGILGPYREKEASFYTVRNVWAPIQFKEKFITPGFDGKFFITNTFLYSNLNSCKMDYKLYSVPSPLKERGLKNKQISGIKKIEEGIITIPSIEPGETTSIKIDVTDNFFNADLLEIVAYNPDGTEMCTWTWPVHYTKDYYNRELASMPVAQIKKNNMPKITYKDSIVTLSANNVAASFNKNTGMIEQFKNENNIIPLTDGPIPVGMKAKFKSTSSYMDNGDAVFVTHYLGGIDSIEWRLNKDGLLNMHSVMLNKTKQGVGFDEAFFEDNITNFGLTFSYPEEQIAGVKWMGRGPYRVWKNRQRGQNISLHQKDYNNTITGESYENLVYPEFKGYHANIYWMTFEDKTNPFTVYSQTDGIYYRIFTPLEPTKNITKGRAFPVCPKGDISFLYEIPAIRCFKPVSQHGPKSQPGMIRIKEGDDGLHMNLVFDLKQ